ncbi:Ntn hydrolase family protein [Yeosuana marina]|uniref:hypothetical protein n=1 Tax=Yeosuana marina TaxID=1565536 RepID=UPI001422B785|nr:hypothetical protein [Yeosuana marina]
MKYFTTLRSLLVIIMLIISKPTFSCTIFCAKDQNDHVWFGNNEDFQFSFKNYVNIFPKSTQNKFGYFTFSRDKPENGNNAMIAGGFNEAGLALDFNSTERIYPVKNMQSKKPYPPGDDFILPYILGNCKTAEEVIDFFNKYWFKFGFRSAQMHVADKNGTFAIISPTGFKVQKNEKFQVSTNYDICSGADGSTCWRFPKATKILSEEKIGYETMAKICQQTAVTGASTTVYSSIYNLNTGDVTFFFGGEYDKPYNTNLKKLLERGRVSIHLTSFFQNNNLVKLYDILESKMGSKAFKKFKKMNLNDKELESLLPNLVYYYTRETNKSVIYPFISEYQKINNQDVDLWFLKAIFEYQNGDLKASDNTLHLFDKNFPDYISYSKDVRNRLKKIYPKNTNSTIKLNGFKNAKSVFVKYKPFSSSLYPINNCLFLNQTENGWETKLNLDKGIYNYTFIVDGNEVLDSEQTVLEIKNLFGETIECHQEVVGFEKDLSKITIEVDVPNKEDVIYVTGNQEAIFQAPLIMMEKVSDFKRKLTIEGHYPFEFNFVTGGAQKKANVLGHKTDIISVSSKSEKTNFKILNWVKQN